MPNGGADVNNLKSKPVGSTDMAAMGAAALAYCAGYQTHPGDRVGLDPLFASSERENPLQSFMVNSADVRADKILENLSARKLEDTRPKQLLSAGFNESLPEKVNVSESVKNDPLLSKVSDLTQKLRRNSYNKYLEEPKLQINDDFKTYMKTFRNCARSDRPEPKACDAINKVLDMAEAGTGPNHAQTFQDKHVLRAHRELFTEYDSDDAATLVEKYNQKKIRVGALFKKLNSLWYKFDAFRQAITFFAEEHKENLPPELQSALKVLITNFQNAMYSAQVQFFPLLRKEALEVRLARIEEAAKLLYLHRQDMPGASDELNQLGNELACLTNYPVGPAFDKLKFSSVPEREAVYSTRR